MHLTINFFTLQSPHRRHPHQNKSSSKHHHRKHGPAPNPANWSPYGCHYYPDPADFPDPDPASLPEEPLRAGEQYFLDLGGKIRKGPVGSGYTCYCAPIIDRVERKMDRNKRDVFRHLDLSHGRLSSRISHLEKKTRDQVRNRNLVYYCFFFFFKVPVIK